jgi:hypothetical protein
MGCHGVRCLGHNSSSSPRSADEKIRTCTAYVNAYVYRWTRNGSLIVFGEDRSRESGLEHVGEYLLKPKGDPRLTLNDLDTYIAKRTDGNRDHHFITIKQLKGMIRNFNEER